MKNEQIVFEATLTVTGHLRVPLAALARLSEALGHPPGTGDQLRVTLAVEARPPVSIVLDVPPQARALGSLWVHEAQLEGDEDLRIGSPVDILDEGGHRQAAVVENISADEYGAVYQIRLTPSLFA